MKPGDTVPDLTFQTDGKAVVVGGFTPTAAPAGVALIARVMPDGTLDGGSGGFGTDGYVKTTLPSGYSAYGSDAQAVALQGSQILIAGTMGTITSGFEMFVARFNADGSLDTTFGVAGYRVLDLPGSHSGKGPQQQHARSGFRRSHRVQAGNEHRVNVAIATLRGRINAWI